MTAEIAIANKHAVALAADSKVTIGGGVATKTYDTVNKVFTLSKIHPVGVMVFGNAEFMDYPWETIIKQFRSEHGAKNRKTVQNWSDDFQEYMEKFGKIEPKHIVGNVKSIVTSWLSEIEDASISRAYATGISIPSDEYTKSLLSLMDDALERCSASPSWMTDAQIRKFTKEYAKHIDAGIASVFPGNTDREILKTSKKLSISALVKLIDSPQSSGFVIAGFGDDDIFPTIIEHATDGYVGSKVKKNVVNTVDISRDRSASIRAFAQKDMVQSFMNGADPSLVLTMSGMFADALVDSCFSVLDEYGLSKNKKESVKVKIKDAAIQRVGAMIGDFGDVMASKFSNPIMDMVDLLPKDELANLAESLVSLTSLKRRVSRGAETVGGAIDVALISKGDGFIWIKRKHYFTMELNPQFVRNYLSR